jgi:hypothetical protein
MKTHGYLFLLAAGLALVLPSAQLRSQLVPAPAPVTDPLQALQALQRANDDLLKRQENTIQELTELTTIAREARIFSKRG